MEKLRILSSRFMPFPPTAFVCLRSIIPNERRYDTSYSPAQAASRRIAPGPPLILPVLPLEAEDLLPSSESPTQK
jgi:hypothetical protein